MKKLLNYKMLSIIAMATLALASCKKDNYDAPESNFSGRVVYNGEALGVRGVDNANYLQFWQDGYQLHTSFNVYITQDGSYSAKLFDGTYKLVMNSGRGPWENHPDTVVVTVSGNTVVDYPVKPYYTLSNISYNLSGNTLTASFTINGINTTRDIQEIALMVNKTAFVDNANTGHLGDDGWVVQKTNLAPGTYTLTLDVSKFSSNAALYARVGLHISGIDQWLFDTKVEKIK